MELSIVGKSIPSVDALEKVTGKAKFCSDFKMPGMLHAKIFRSPYPHAKVVSIDISKAERLRGVRAVVGPKDAPSGSISLNVADQYVLSRDNIVRFVGDPIAAVAADTVEIAEEALDLIEVDYEELPSVFDIEEAFKQDPPAIIHPNLLKYGILTTYMPPRPLPNRPNVLHTFSLRSGDIEKGFREADLIVENKFSTARIQHCPLEPHQAIAWWEPDGSLTVRTSVQVGSGVVKPMLSRVFGVPASKVRLLSTHVGGGFGGKGNALVEALVALLAKKSGKPVRLIFTRTEMFVAGRHRVPMIFDVKDGVKTDGTLIARELKIILPLGGYADVGMFLVKRVVAGAVGTYRVPNVKIDSHGVYTNGPLTGPFRGFGVPEVVWAIEQEMDIIAETLQIDPVEIRKKNMLNEGDRDAGGQITHDIGLKDCLDKVVEGIGWGEKKIGGEQGPWRKGKGIAVGSKSIMTGTSSVVIVKVCPDGMIEVRHNAPQIGQGISTTLAQIAAEEFGVSIDHIKIVTGDTDFCGYDFGASSSRGLFHNGNALLSACRDAKQRLFDIASSKLEAEPSDLETKGGRIYVKGVPARSMGIVDLFTPAGIPLKGGEILGTGSYTGPGIPEDPVTGQSERYAVSHSYAANAVEVAVNTETGEVKVLKVVGAFDVGKAINPKIVEGQIEGGTAMTIGTAIYEQIVMDKGVVVNPSFIDYRIPTTTVMPRNENLISAIIEVLGQEGPFGAKPVGELVTVPLGPAIGNAVYDAVGVRIKDLPISREKVFEAFKKKQQAVKDKNERV